MSHDDGRKCSWVGHCKRVRRAAARLRDGHGGHVVVTVAGLLRSIDAKTARLAGRFGWKRVGFVAVAGFPFAFLLAFVAYPLWQELWGSFSKWYQLKPAGLEGLGNYASLFDDIDVPVSALHTVFYVLLTVPAEVVIGLATAWATLRARRGRGLLAVAFLFPMAVPWTVAGTLFNGLFGVGGVVDRLGQQLFGTGAMFNWLDHPRLAFGVVVGMGIWKGAPWCFLLLLGALSGCPEDVFEAARVDGARGWSFWWHVVLPSLQPMLALVVVLRVISETQAYYPVALLTNGGPGFPGATELVGFYDNTLAFGFQNFGEATALGTLVGAVLVVVAAIGWALAQPRVSSRRLYLSGPRRGLCGRRFWVGMSRMTAWRPVWLGALARSCAGPGGREGARRWRGLSARARGAVVLGAMAAVLLPLGGEASAWLGGSGFSHTDWSWVETGLLNTLVMSVVTVGCTLLLAVPAAYLLAYKKFRLRGALFMFVLFTLAIPGVIFVYPQFEEIVWLGLVNTRAGMLALYVTSNLPLAIFFLRPAFSAVPVRLIEAMRVDGASGLGILRRLVLRFSASTIVALVVLIVVWVWGEVPVAVAVLSPNNVSSFTLPLVVAEGQVGNPNAVNLVSIAVPLCLFVATQRFFRRGLVSGSLL